MSALLTLSEHIAADRRISPEEAFQLRQAIFPDGVVSRQEADVLISLEGRVANSDEAWSQAFVEGIVDHVLAVGEYPGHVDENTTSWLMSRFGDDGARETEIEVLLKTLERAESAPASLAAYARKRVAAWLAGKPVGAQETEFIRRALYVAAGAGATAVTEDEARWLFAVDAESDGRANDATWTDLFVKGVLNHLMGRRAPVSLEQGAMLRRETWFAEQAQGPLGDSLATMFDGGLKGFMSRSGAPDDVTRLEQRYEAVAAEMQQDEVLTLAEIAWAVGMSREDGKRTANETALLAKLRELEAEAKA
ncbi:MAG: hypothetical protein M0D54_00575 [Hyphomonadaceae bacterium JAD_PAG50586_4]|nr:MAG: hypothetical protein M0D54_00575 [Hyphomonadaceae bacterium JAD_PAG50586_4]